MEWSSDTTIIQQTTRSNIEPCGFNTQYLMRWVFGKAADHSTLFISRIERGRESTTLDNLVKIAKALRVRVRDLVAGF